MIALYFLTSSKASVKAKYISALYHEYEGPRVEEEVRGGFGDSLKRIEKVFRPAANLKGDILQKDHLLRKQIEIKQVFTIFTAVSLNLLPYFASDFPEHEKAFYYKLYCQWNSMRDKITDNVVTSFCRADK